MSTLKKPDLSDPKLRAKLAKGMGHNYYGEPAWPNDLLYIFPVCILGTIACCIGLGVLEPTPLGERADPFATPLEILPEWYFFPTFNLLRVLPNKLLGVLAIRGMTLDGGMKGVSFLFNPRFGDLSASAIVLALGHSFFTVSLGMGTMITYGSYLKKDQNLLSCL